MSEEAEGLQACDAAVTLAFSILGKRWNGMILSTLGDCALTFVALRRGVTGISDAVLSDRLSELTEAGLVSREVQPGPPVSVSYALTPRGQAVVPLLEQLGKWAAENLVMARGTAPADRP